MLEYLYTIKVMDNENFFYFYFYFNLISWGGGLQLRDALATPLPGGMANYCIGGGSMARWPAVMCLPTTSTHWPYTIGKISAKGYTNRFCKLNVAVAVIRHHVNSWAHEHMGKYLCEAGSNDFNNTNETLLSE